MTGVAIVAVPNKSDLVWSVSSEKIPHMTILYLGDALAKKDYQHVQEFVTHVADTVLVRFGMSVDKRGVLGSAEADVLFFKNKDNSNISLFRSYLLQDTIIREAYESVEQFDGWTPHLTLGYPEAPAKKVPKATDEFYWVGFDRLMIWTGDFEGPEIELKDEDLTQSDLLEGEDFLAHFGVKGMKWGQRKSAAERRHDRTVKIQEKAAASIAKSQELQARAEARTAKADAKAAASTAKLETKVAKKEAALAKTEARIGVDDPSNSYVRPSSGIAGKTNAESVRLRADAAKSARTLDDATLKAYTQRIDTEKKLKQAIAEDASPRKAAAKKLIGEAGRDVAKTALVGVGSLAVYYAIGRMSGTHKLKFNPEGAAGVLTKGKSSTKDAFTSVDKMAELAGGTKVPMSEIAKWKKPPSMGRNATPF